LEVSVAGLTPSAGFVIIEKDYQYHRTEDPLNFGPLIPGSEMLMSPDNWLTQLRDNGYRLTEARRAVVETVARSRRALSPIEVYDAARKRYHALGLVSVYRTLEKLEELHLVQRVHQPQGCQAFIAAGQGHQHLLLCQRCGRVTFFEGDDLKELMSTIASRTGYRIRDHWLQLFGLCASCQ
jgi:Fur family ferric uptake transcriptional regulator